jgi:protease-4
VIVALLSNLVWLLTLPLALIRRARAAPRGAYVEIVIDGEVVEYQRPVPRLLALLRRDAKPVVSVTRVRELAKALRDDDAPAGVLVRVKSLIAGQAIVTSLRQALEAIKKSGKDVVVHLPYGATNATLYLASVGRVIIVGPETTIASIGYAVSNRYIKGALERAGVEPEVYAKGMYKSAGETLVRDRMSDAQREQLGVLIEGRHDELVQALAQSRSVEVDVVRRWIDEAPHRADAAVTLGIVDAVAYDDEVERAFKARTPTHQGELVTVKVGNYLASRGALRRRPLRPSPFIGIIEVHGPIVGAPRFVTGGIAAEERLVSELRAARESHGIKGVVLHIDSPGGSALASDRIYHEVARLAEKKPVIAYMSNVAASGGYYVAAGAHAIVAQPSTITGSIGVVAARFVVAPLLERLGVLTEVVKRGAHADMFSPTRRFDESERAAFERELEAFYRTFLGVVAKSRGKTVEAIEPLAQGRVYTGTDAHARGLVDHLGGFDRALDLARERIGDLSLEPRLVVTPKRTPPAPRLPAAAAQVLEALGLGDAMETAQLSLDARGDRVLAYAGSTDRVEPSSPYR